MFGRSSVGIVMGSMDSQRENIERLYSSLKISRALYTAHIRTLCSHCSVVLQHSAAEPFYDLTTLSNTKLKHQS